MTNDARKPEGKRNKNPVVSGNVSTITIQKTMPVRDVVTLLPEAEKVLAEYGLHCFHCSASAWETLDEGCKSHGFDDVDIDDLVDDLNTLLQEKPKRPFLLLLTDTASKALKSILISEGKESFGMLVAFDERGSFCLEFQEEPGKEERVFSNASDPSVRLFASPLTLMRIGGATVDFRDERFKLDLPEDAAHACSCKSGGCGCAKKMP